MLDAWSPNTRYADQAEEAAAAHTEALEAGVGDAQQDKPQPSVAADEFVKPTPPASRPTSSRPTSASLRRAGGSKSNSRAHNLMRSESLDRRSRP